MRIDHVVLGSRSLDASAERLLRDHGLASLPGGRHPGWGTGNRIIPLGHDYVELLAVVDPAAASRSAFGRFMTELTADGDRWFTLCIGDDDLEGTADRLGLEVVTGSRERLDGTIVRWSSAGLEDPKREPWMPFFIRWEVPPDRHPGAAPLEHRVPVTGISWVEMGGDVSRVRDWLGGEDLPIRPIDGDPGVRAVALSTADGSEIVLI